MFSLAPRARLLAGLAVLGAAVAAGAPAEAEEPERELALKRGGGAVTWDGTLAPGTNQTYDAASGEPCADSLEDQCDTTLLRVVVPDGFWDTRGGGVEVSLTNYTVPASDFDLYIYKSNAAGERGKLVATSAGLPAEEELTEIPTADGFYLIQVVYYAVVPASSYKGTADFAITDQRAPVPPDVDRPPGLQEVLASNPRRGYRSHSEPHIAQSPTRPNLLVAASKFYNKDPDSLREYEFKIGTYVSFNGGRSWHDLGQTATCRKKRARPRSWPNNDCYPRDNPNRQGTGDEDKDPAESGLGGDRVDVLSEKAEETLEGEVGEIGEESALPSAELPSAERRGGDYGEEYITSDPWVQFDDEGNVYLMVLDSPPFPSGAGWGMSFHRWVTPSRKDLDHRKRSTWSRKIIINAYPDEPQQSDFLDDKNTFAVNNAGPDQDGNPGIIVACWGQNITTAIKQQTVCERSTDGGRSWPDEPQPISSPAEQLVIGVSVVADNVDPNRFYAFWYHYTPTITGGPGEYRFAFTEDGGQTWVERPAAVTEVNPLPTQLPGSNFRNLSIPIMSAGPNEGELYTTYAEYQPASAEDTDEMQADIMLVKSTDGGLTWSAPQKVNGDSTDADQFQPTVAVTPSGQVNISYFDRRKDPDNFYIDTYLSRSNDGGATFTDTRVSHDMWDPSQKPPISGSGEFIGDYQGLVADDCFARPFVNDTHLANGARRDAGLDQGVRRSRFQEAISWRVPNTAKFGGQAVEGC